MTGDVMKAVCLWNMYRTPRLNIYNPERNFLSPTSLLTFIQLKLEDLNFGPSLFPTDPKSRAHCRLWSDHVSARISLEGLLFSSLPRFMLYYSSLLINQSTDQSKHYTKFLPRTPRTRAAETN